MFAPPSPLPLQPGQGGPVAAGKGNRVNGRRLRFLLRGTKAGNGPSGLLAGSAGFSFAASGAGFGGAGGLVRRGGRRAGKRPGGGVTPSIRQTGRR